MMLRCSKAADLTSFGAWPRAGSRRKAWKGSSDPTSPRR